MNIIQWNCNGFYARLPFLKLLVNDNCPQILCLQETNFKGNQSGKLPGFITSFCNRNNAQIASGGVAILVKSDIYVHNIPLQTSLEATAVKVNIISHINICNIYIPNRQDFDVQDLDNILQQLPKPFIIVGDFNSHNIL